jgi:hypothetical protein
MTDEQAKQLYKLECSMLESVHRSDYVNVIYLARYALKLSKEANGQTEKDKSVG